MMVTRVREYGWMGAFSYEEVGMVVRSCGKLLSPFRSYDEKHPARTYQAGCVVKGYARRSYFIRTVMSPRLSRSLVGTSKVMKRCGRATEEGTFSV